MGSDEFNATRSSVVSPAYGAVLEIGFGSGYNLPFYINITRLYALDPSPELFNYAHDRIKAASFLVEYLKNSAENIPLGDNSIDTIVSTWSMCSIPNLEMALREMHRVLKPDGRLLFVEHGQSNQKIFSITQRILTPITKLFTGNCHLDRKIDVSIIKVGFKIEKLHTFTEDGRPLMFSYRGVASK